MLHEFPITDEQKDQMTALINAMTAVTGGKAEIVTRLAVVTEDERIIAAMNSLIKTADVRKSTPRAPGAGKPEKGWTIVSTGERITYDTLMWRIGQGKFAVGDQLFHADKGNHIVDCKEDGKLALKKVMA